MELKPLLRRKYNTTVDTWNVWVLKTCGQWFPPEKASESPSCHCLFCWGVASVTNECWWQKLLEEIRSLLFPLKAVLGLMAAVSSAGAGDGADLFTWTTLAWKCTWLLIAQLQQYCASFPDLILCFLGQCQLPMAGDRSWLCADVTHLRVVTGVSCHAAH